MEVGHGISSELRHTGVYHLKDFSIIVIVALAATR